MLEKYASERASQARLGSHMPLFSLKMAPGNGKHRKATYLHTDLLHGRVANLCSLHKATRAKMCSKYS